MAVLEALSPGRLLGGGGLGGGYEDSIRAESADQANSADSTPTLSADQIYAAHTREDLARYNEELAPLEELYASHLIGPQAEANRANFMQTVNKQSDMAFDRAGARMSERNRRFGLSADRNETRKLQRGRQLSKATNSTQGGRFYDQQRTDLL